jgi:GxxExxY protein
MKIDDITFRIRGGIFAVYNELGPGLLESVYSAALKEELQTMGLRVRSEVSLPVLYKGKDLNLNYRLDLLVENAVVIELKSVETLHSVHHKQLLTYLKLSGHKLGILVNFNTTNLRENIFRKVHGF